MAKQSPILITSLLSHRWDICLPACWSSSSWMMLERWARWTSCSTSGGGFFLRKEESFSLHVGIVLQLLLCLWLGAASPLTPDSISWRKFSQRTRLYQPLAWRSSRTQLQEALHYFDTFTQFVLLLYSHLNGRDIITSSETLHLHQPCYCSSDSCPVARGHFMNRNQISLDRMIFYSFAFPSFHFIKI